MINDIKPNEFAKVIMRMSEKTLSNIDAISEMTGNSNTTTVVARAIKVYRDLLEIQQKEKGRILVERKSGNLLQITFNT